MRRFIEIEERWFHWLCGVIEGEGSFARASSSAPRKPRIAISISDEDTIRRVTELFSTQAYRIAVNSQRFPWSYRTELVGGSAISLMRIIRPYMSARRQEQIDSTIASYTPGRPIVHKTFSIRSDDSTEHDRYWLAGYLGSQGKFGRDKHSFYRLLPMVENNTIDPDTAEKVRSIWLKRYGVSVDVLARAPRKPGYKAHYMTRAMGREALTIIDDLYDLLSTRRRLQIDALLGENWRQPKRLGEDRSRSYVVITAQSRAQGQEAGAGGRRQEAGSRRQEAGWYILALPSIGDPASCALPASVASDPASCQRAQRATLPPASCLLPASVASDPASCQRAQRATLPPGSAFPITVQKESTDGPDDPAWCWHRCSR
jgi:hypothetical protein